ncbi:hypothetical protein FHW94_000293 [Novosphingobium sp. SG720]|nr:hypothetical protein [Novosphingobium sp. SG720]
MESFSNVVATGMRRVCAAFSQIVMPYGFKPQKGRKWVRESEPFEEIIWISRSGATYGAPHSPSISLQLSLTSIRLRDEQRTDLSHHESGLIRRSTGYCYHHRFNAKTNSTYERCLDELELFVTEVAETWFEQQRRQI